MEKIKSQETELSDDSTEYKITPKKRPPSAEPIAKPKRERSEKQLAHFARLQEINKKRRETARKVKSETQQQVEKVLNAKKILADHEETLSDGEKIITKARRIVENVKISPSLEENDMSELEDEPVERKVKKPPKKPPIKPPKKPKKKPVVVVEESSDSDYTEESIYEEESITSSSSSEEEVVVRKKRKPVKKQKEIRPPKQEAIKYNIPTETIYFA